MRSQDASALLRTTDLFAGLDDETAAQLAKQMVTRNYRKGQPLVHQGDAGTALFVIVDGSVAVYVTSENGDRMTLNTLGPTDVLGEIALLDNGPRTATVTVTQPARALVLGPSQFRDVLHQNAEIAVSMLYSVVQRLRAGSHLPHG